ncbi:MAG: putative membrane protein [uncultured archaeon A07HR60]|nr:MAG: putative membrane protein [uncultured archaeon A07HR60]
MASRRDPVEEASDGSHDLYDIVTWEERSSLDGLSVAVHWLVVRSAKAAVVLVALLILLTIVGQIGLGIFVTPAVGVLTLLSVIPALGLATYVWYADVTEREPLTLLVATFLLAVLTAGFAAVINSSARPLFVSLGPLGVVLFYFVIVAPVEESVKLLAVRLYAYNDTRFDAVINGAVYGAVAGLGFATIENSLYIIDNVDAAELGVGVGLVGAGDGIAALRALAGPGHVIYSAFAGYYLGLAKFNPSNRGPIVVKGLVIAGLLHATYNSTVSIGSGLIAGLTGLPPNVAFVVYITLFVGVTGGILFAKIRRYREAYLEVTTEPGTDPPTPPKPR